VQENVDFFGALHGVKDKGARREQLLDLTHLAEFRGRRADALSGGMQKKLALACTLIHTPKVLFLDEPTTGVDPLSRRELWKLLSGLVVEGLSVLLSTPYLDEAERCARVALVRDGRTLAFDTAPALKASLGARVVEVVCSPVRRARELLAHHPRVQDVRLYGDRVHVFPARAGDDLSDVVRSLAGVGVTAVRTIEPSLEDVFIRLVTHATHAEPAHG
jgi:ABC-2 type transport system ATP-binding protein